ncbi:MAG: hypothetical protein BGO91_13765 [Leifsonia sp. 71-9]|nr:MAG: hypothetical protein BGO91_13765 [Leifsonia sp. 71-9]
MPSFEELMAKRKAAPPKTVKVEVLLDVESSEEIAALQAQMDDLASNADQRLGVSDGSEEIQAQIDALKDVTADAILTLEFERLPGDLWTDVIAKNPSRGESALDLTYGYNVDAAARAAAKAQRGGHAFGWCAEDGKSRTLTDEQWDDLFSMLSGHDMTEIRDAIWNLNEWAPTMRLLAAKKASAGIETGSN